jgi:hypothetical protein
MPKKGLDLDPRAGIWNSLGIAYYRAGDWQPAVTALKKSMELREGGDCYDWFFLAMAHWKLGHKEEARKWHGQASAWMEQKEYGDPRLRRFRAEAAALLGVTDPNEQTAQQAETKNYCASPRLWGRYYVTKAEHEQPR